MTMIAIVYMAAVPSAIGTGSHAAHQRCVGWRGVAVCSGLWGAEERPAVAALTQLSVWPVYEVGFTRQG